ncbi:FAD-binding oxidoreductase [Cellulomonas marina]|uniref:FAD/FMN-containing dehydrogenase n=1 Tax=Cellulomonas marina TaxID=988821 RepID=A0A1I0V869_9CELL|nr:FAD-binding oxidoreductase [Cellulomonas marina]GIG29229.1 dehydrogenase [Cellulomonas marina]SFA72478.1 FAD/FMN-containing dehydrogenase [Cellulomonas marina]
MTATAARPAPATLAALAAELRSLLGDRAVTTELAAREKASVDGAHLSPVISAQLPLGLADLVAFPTTAEGIAQAVGAAVRHGVPVTPRGKGTGNYGQAIPMAGGLVLDLSRARTVVEVGDGFVTADAGATLVALEQAAGRTGQQVLMYPSTAQSSIGGFLSGGSGGTGSIAHGMLHTGFALALDVVHAVPDARLVHVEGADAEPYLHTYGTAGIIARATVRLEPLQDWRALYASFGDFADALSVLRPFADLTPTPRLVSADLPTLAEALPADPAIPAGRSSLRAIVDAASLDAARALVEGAGGRVEDVREGPQATMKLSMLSYNHPVEWLQKAHPGRYFHVEVAGDALVERIDEVHAVYPGGMLHIEAQRGRPIGMLVGEYESPEAVWAGFERLTALGVGFHNPHQWAVDHEPEQTAALAATTDPAGLLNPGKLARTDVAPLAPGTVGGIATRGAAVAVTGSQR